MVPMNSTRYDCVFHFACGKRQKCKQIMYKYKMEEDDNGLFWGVSHVKNFFIKNYYWHLFCLDLLGMLVINKAIF